MSNKIIQCDKQLNEHIPFFFTLNRARKAAFLNMCVDIGIDQLLEYFTDAIEYMSVCDWERAANSILVSRWAKQNSKKAIELSETIRKGE